jgi:acyl carrier protein
MIEKLTGSSPTTMSADVLVLRRDLAELITQALGLDIAPPDIDADAPLYGQGLGLDSIDILEIAMVIAKEYGIQLKADSKENQAIFSSLNALAHYVANQRSR